MLVICHSVMNHVWDHMMFAILRIGYMETTDITASVRHRPADNGVTLVVLVIMIYSVCVRACVCVHACVCVCVCVCVCL